MLPHGKCNNRPANICPWCDRFNTRRRKVIKLPAIGVQWWLSWAKRMQLHVYSNVYMSKKVHYRMSFKLVLSQEHSVRHGFDAILCLFSCHPLSLYSTQVCYADSVPCYIQYHIKLWIKYLLSTINEMHIVYKGIPCDSYVVYSL